MTDTVNTETYWTHKCPVPGCRESHLPFKRLMCWKHWRKVPKALQDQVYDSWKGGRPGAGYLLARQAAIDAAAGRVEKSGG